MYILASDLKKKNQLQGRFQVGQGCASNPQAILGGCEPPPDLFAPPCEPPDY